MLLFVCLLFQVAQYVLAVAEYCTAEDTLLSFAAGDVIRLESKEGIDDGKLKADTNPAKGPYMNKKIDAVMHVVKLNLFKVDRKLGSVALNWETSCLG